jgi:uridylate kinase
MGMIGTIMNGLAMADFIDQRGGHSIVLSAIEIPRVCDFFHRSKALHHFKQGRVVICVAGTGNSYFSTDSGAVQRALEMDCDMVVKATKVNGIYDSDPVINP